MGAGVPTLRSIASGVLLAAVLAAPAFSPPAAVAADWSGWDLRCDTGRVDLTSAGDGWALIGDERSAKATAAGRPLAESLSLLWLVGQPQAAPRRLQAAAWTDGRRAGLEASWNGHDLGRREVRRRRQVLEWEVPAAALRRGANTVVLRRAAGGRGGEATVTVEGLAADPAGCPGPGRPGPIAVDPASRLTLGPDSLVRIPFSAEPPARLDISFRARDPDRAFIRVECYTSREVLPMAKLTAGAKLRAREHLPLSAECARAAGLILTREGPGSIDEASVKLADAGAGGWPWRPRLEGAALAAGLVALIALAAARLGRDEPSAPPTLWLDAGWIVLAALVVRIGFFVVYPRPGESGDAHGYLLQAGLLAQGHFSFWGDTGWHAWHSFVRPPGYYAFLAAAVGPSGMGRSIAILLQLVFSAVAAGATYFLAYPLFGRVAAWAAGLLFALYLASIATFSRFLTEPLFMLFALPALAATAWLTRRPSAGLALAAGVLFGLASLVRAGPLQYVPLAGLLLIASLGWKRGLRTAAVMGAATLVTVLPWCVRNAVVAGFFGIENVSVANLVLDNPDERLVEHRDLDLNDPRDRRAYTLRIENANRDGALARRRGEITRRLVLSAVRDPAAHLGRLGRQLGTYLDLLPDRYLRWILWDHDTTRIARLTAIANTQYLAVAVLALGGVALRWRDRATWPILAWFFFNTAVVVFFFHPMARFRFQTIPVLMALAGAALAALIETLARRRDATEPPRATESMTR